MNYNANTLKLQYEKNCLEQRKKNLVRLREQIACLTQTEFSKRTGIQKSNLSYLENGDRDMSLFNIQVYKTYFLEHHSLNVSTDYLLGYTDIIRNESMNTSKDLNLSNDSLECLKYLSTNERNLNLLKTLNFLMSDKILFEQLLSNIDIILNLKSWMPAVCVDCNQTDESCNISKLNINECHAFVKINSDGKDEGALLIDESILESHALIIIEKIIKSYEDKVRSKK